MRDLKLQGAVRGKKHRTTIADDCVARPRDLVDRDFREHPRQTAVDRGPQLRAELVGSFTSRSSPTCTHG